MKKLFLFVAISLLSPNSYSMFNGCKRRAKKTTKHAAYACSKVYKLESLRTAATRSAMAAACLADGAITGGEVTILALASASLITATTYDANAKQRCALLPEKLNLVADGIATIASTDAGWIPITGTDTEETIRAGVGIVSTLTSIISLFF